MVYEMKLNERPFEKISAGEKTVELRLYDDKRRRLNPGDYIVFNHMTDDTKHIAVKIRALYRYESFEDLFSDIDPYKCGNDKETTPKEAAECMRKYYSKERERILGVLGIKIEKADLEKVRKLQEEHERDVFEHYFPDGMK